MKRLLIPLLTLTLLLTACAPATTAPDPVTTGTATQRPTSTPVPPSATPRPTISPTPESNRSASFTSIEKAVEARNSEEEAYAPAALGQTFPAGGQARTDETGRARLDLSPDGTIIRIVPNTIFTLPELGEKDGEPFTLLDLIIGQIYILLNGGELQVRTPSGVAAVRGSMLGVSYDPQTGRMTATCLEGHCSLRNESGTLDLVAGQAADILDGVLSREPRSITDAELFNWLEFTPELDGVLDQLPLLRDRLKILPEIPRRRPKLP